MNAFRLRLSCNDDQGVFTGKLARLELARGVTVVEGMVTIECVLEGAELPVIYGPSPSRFTIGTRWWRHCGHRTHSGGLPWDELVVEPSVAAFALNYVAGSITRLGTPRYHVTGGLARIVGRVDVASVRSIDLERA